MEAIILHGVLKRKSLKAHNVRVPNGDRIYVISSRLFSHLIWNVIKEAENQKC